jgi:hypothetical protein
MGSPFAMAGVITLVCVLASTLVVVALYRRRFPRSVPLFIIWGCAAGGLGACMAANYFNPRIYGALLICQAAVSLTGLVLGGRAGLLRQPRPRQVASVVGAGTLVLWAALVLVVGTLLITRGGILPR